MPLYRMDDYEQAVAGHRLDTPATFNFGADVVDAGRAIRRSSPSSGATPGATNAGSRSTTWRARATASRTGSRRAAS